jgi:pimeloyl-ACP methyl ester carboxylesterase
MAEEVNVRGRRVELARSGQGSPILYLHGAGIHEWMPVHDLLAREHRVYLPAHPGFGATEGMEEIETIEDLVFHTVDVMDSLGLESPDVIGLSLGGWLAAELALRHPHRVQRLVLVDAAGLDVPGVERPDILMAPPPRARALLFADPESETARRLVPDVVPPERAPAALRAREAAARLLDHPHAEFRRLARRLWRITAQTVVIWGAEDRLLPVSHALAWEHGIPGARLLMLDGCGHLPPLEQPERFAKLVLDFLLDY